MQPLLYSLVAFKLSNRVVAFSLSKKCFFLKSSFSIQLEIEQKKFFNSRKKRAKIYLRPLILIYNINIITKKTTTSIILKVELPCNINPNDFYDELYKKRLTHEFIRNELGLPEDIKIKLNGTFTRGLCYTDDNNNVCKIRFKIQTAVWMEPETGKWKYVSIFPCFIKKYCALSLHMLENISSRERKGDKIFDHIDDPEKLFDCEDSIVRVFLRFEKAFKISDPCVLLNSRYIEMGNEPINLNTSSIASKRFKKLYQLILTARVYFGIETGVLSLTNSIICL